MVEVADIVQLFHPQLASITLIVGTMMIYETDLPN